MGASWAVEMEMGFVYGLHLHSRDRETRTERWSPSTYSLSTTVLDTGVARKRRHDGVGVPYR